MSSREAGREAKARPPHGAGAKLVCSLLFSYCFSFRGEESFGIANANGDESDRPSFLAGDPGADLDAMLSRKLFADFTYPGNRPAQALPPEFVRA